MPPFHRIGRTLRRGSGILLLGGATLAPLLQCPSVAAPDPAAAATRASLPPSEVDASIVLRVGSLEVSRYALEKQYRQFLARNAEVGRPPPDPAGTARWFESFHARQLATAHALTLGYGTHPAVVRLVDTMECYMLSQPEGPYYHALYAAEPALTPEEIDRHFAAAQRELHMVALVFPVSARDGLLGETWESMSTNERLAQLVAARTTPDTNYHDGWSAWPYLPVDHAAASLAITPAGAWLEVTRDAIPEPWNAVIHIRAERMLTPPADEAAARRAFTQALEQHRKRQIQQARRAQALRAARFTFVPTTASDLLAALSTLPPQTFELIPGALGPRTDAPLCHYEDASGAHTVSGADWADAFNRLFLRQLPGDIAALRRSAENLVLARLDEADARRLGLDRTPQFTEDRRNFHYAQVLDVFERERLLPEIGISAEAIAAYFAAHAASFPPVPATTVRCLRFPSEDAASAWLRQTTVATSQEKADGSATPTPLEDTTSEISTTRALPGASYLTFSLLNAQPGDVAGPLTVDGNHFIFIKASPTRQVPATLTDVAPEIRDRLTQEAREARLLALARTVAPTLPCENRIPYERFGLSHAPSLGHSSSEAGELTAQDKTSDQRKAGGRPSPGEK